MSQSSYETDDSETREDRREYDAYLVSQGMKPYYFTPTGKRRKASKPVKVPRKKVRDPDYDTSVFPGASIPDTQPLGSQQWVSDAVAQERTLAFLADRRATNWVPLPYLGGGLSGGEEVPPTPQREVVDLTEETKDDFVGGTGPIDLCEEDLDHADLLANVFDQDCTSLEVDLCGDCGGLEVSICDVCTCGYVSDSKESE